MNKEKSAIFLLQLGLAAVFLYAAAASFLDPVSWAGFFPPFLKNIIDAKTLLAIFSVYEIILTVWILSGFKLFYASLISAATLAGIIALNLGALDILFRDFAILFSAVALAVLSYGERDRI